MKTMLRARSLIQCMPWYLNEAFPVWRTVPVALSIHLHYQGGAIELCFYTGEQKLAISSP